MSELVTFRQVWTSHNGRHEGGRATHATRGLELSEEEESPRCGVDVSNHLATTGDVRSEPRDKLDLYLDCGRCLRILGFARTPPPDTPQ